MARAAHIISGFPSFDCKNSRIIARTITIEYRKNTGRRLVLEMRLPPARNRDIITVCPHHITHARTNARTHARTYLTHARTRFASIIPIAIST